MTVSKLELARLLSRAILGVLLSVSMAGPARAQLPIFPAEDESTLVPPELIEGAAAEYPEAAKRQGLEATVVLKLSIAVNGDVTSVEVVEAAGHGFDEQAREAALKFRFNPALRGGQAVPARITYRYSFVLPPPPNPVPDAAPERHPADSSSTVAPAQPVTPVTVTVVGELSEAQRLQQSAEAVNVIDTRRAKEQSADLGEVLARTQGIVVRREGGLGSGERFALNGLYDEQVRFFVDGVPQEFSAYPFGMSNVPVNLVNRVEVYRGVVPARFGVDALGGAINLVTDQQYESRMGASYQVGSFGTHRVTLNGRYRHEPTGFVTGLAAFVDRAKNDYEVDVEVSDERGRVRPVTVKRFHDAYGAFGATLEAGFVEKPWAKRLLFQAFAAKYDKELQHNVSMSIPYGEPTYGEKTYGVLARYDVDLPAGFDLDVVASYSRRAIDFVDKGTGIYDWTGARIGERLQAGETSGSGTDLTTYQHAGMGRVGAGFTPNERHALRAAVTGNFATRSDEERFRDDPDEREIPSLRRDLFTLVSGLEYELSLIDKRLVNIILLKDYFYQAKSEEPLRDGALRERDTKRHTQGIGDSLRFRLYPWLYAKASYEYATRLPRPDEVFGDGALVLANLDLVPEVSHNANIGPRLELNRTLWGDFVLDVNAFLRDSDRLIYQSGRKTFAIYQNVYAARGIGVENAASWTAPRRLISVDGTLTYQDVRNRSEQGLFSGSSGERIPNRPYLMGSWGARMHFGHAPHASDSIDPFYHGRYVHEFYQGWADQGIPGLKHVIPAQITHSAGVTWTFTRQPFDSSATIEIDNFTDARVFDNFGVQRPGRAFYLKLVAELS